MSETLRSGPNSGVIWRLGVNALFLVAPIMVYLGYGQGVKQEEQNNSEAANFADELTVCNSLLSDLGYPEELLLNEMSEQTLKMCQLSGVDDQTVVLQRANPDVRVSEVEFTATLPTQDELFERIGELQDDAQDFDHSVPLGYMTLYGAIGSGYTLLGAMIKTKEYY